MPIRVLIVTTDSRICGTERKIISLLHHIDRTRFEPYVITLKGPGDLIEEAKKLNTYAVNLDAEKIKPIQLWRKWWREIKNIDPFIIHSFLHHSNLFARLTRLFRPKTYVISSLESVYSVEAYGYMYGWLERWTHWLDHQYITCSQIGYQSARDAIGLPTKKMKNIRNAIEKYHFNESEDEIRIQTRQEFGFHDDDLVIGVVAQLRWAKRHDILLRSTAKLIEHYPQIKILIVGEGEMENKLRALTNELHLQNQVIFTGFRTDAQRLLFGMDIFALPSEVEGQPVSIMEAMQAGLPVVSTRAGGIPEIVEEGQTAFLAEPGDETTFCESLEKILKNPQQITEMGQKGKQYVEQVASAEAMAREYEECYSSFLK